MDYGPLFPKLFELQKLISRKAELALRVAGADARERSYRLELDLRRDIHKVGGERARFNETGHISFMQEERERDEVIKADYRELCVQITTLEEQIEAEFTTTSL
jgi:hypothetical protein